MKNRLKRFGKTSYRFFSRQNGEGEGIWQVAIGWKGPSIRRVSRPYVETHYSLAANACGLCQVGVPCESRIPGRRRGADDESKSSPVTA